MTHVPEIEGRRCRGFSVFDAMILIAAGAIGLSFTRGGFLYMVRDLSQIKVPNLGSLQGWKSFLFGSNHLALNFCRFSNILLLNFIVWFLFAFLVIRLRRPRPNLRDLAFQPGFAVCASAVFAFFLVAVAYLLPLPPAVGQFLVIVVIAVAPTAWLTLLVSRRWNPEPEWIDRLGSVIGALYIVSSITHMVIIDL
jgi:hypothetical protein